MYSANTAAISQIIIMRALLCTLSLAIVAVAWTDATEDDRYARFDAYVAKMADNSPFKKAMEEHFQTFPIGKAERLGADPCNPSGIPKGKTTSVHNLMPTDVKVIAAMGDSLTAASAAKATGILTIFNLRIQYRGISWSIGGDDTITEHRTLPNLIKMYDPQLTGFSTKTGDQESANAHLNVAVPGETSGKMLAQATLLIERLKSTPDINFDNDWKVITLFVGGNDLCLFCHDKAEYTKEKYVAHVQAALDLLHAEVPKAFVNLAVVENVQLAQDLNKGLFCSTLHLFLCDCAAYPPDEAAKKELKDLGESYRTGISDLVNSGRYDTRQDFTVVVQPFYTNTDIPDLPGTSDPDFSYFAADCFHFSEKGHGAAAEALWNNMLEPVGAKRLAWTPGEPILCPTAEHPFFYTNKNSPKQNVGSSNDATDDIEGLTPPSNEGSAGLTGGILAGVLGACILVAVAIIIKRRRNMVTKTERRPILI